MIFYEWVQTRQIAHGFDTGLVHGSGACTPPHPIAFQPIRLCPRMATSAMPLAPLRNVLKSDGLTLGDLAQLP